jgi:hyperosmotically inducible periplasmic protein
MRDRTMAMLAASVFASVALAAAPAPVLAETTTGKVERKAHEIGNKAKAVTQDARSTVTDSWLTSKTKIAIFGDARLKSAQVGVDTVDGIVTLRGKVDSDEARAAAGSVAGAIEGVKSVRNDLQVVAPGDRKTVDVSDKEITGKVEERFATNEQLKGIGVRTDDGVIILSGKVSNIEASAQASEIARDVPGVRFVKNDLTYDGARPAADRPSRTGRVMATQQALKARGFDPGPIDGLMGPGTASALRDYQKSENIAITGRMDADTAAKLGMK